MFYSIAATCTPREHVSCHQDSIPKIAIGDVIVSALASLGILFTLLKMAGVDLGGLNTSISISNLKGIGCVSSGILILEAGFAISLLSKRMKSQSLAKPVMFRALEEETEGLTASKVGNPTEQNLENLKSINCERDVKRIEPPQVETQEAFAQKLAHLKEMALTNDILGVVLKHLPLPNLISYRLVSKQFMTVSDNALRFRLKSITSCPDNEPFMPILQQSVLAYSLKETKNISPNVIKIPGLNVQLIENYIAIVGNDHLIMSHILGKKNDLQVKGKIRRSSHLRYMKATENKLLLCFKVDSIRDRAYSHAIQEITYDINEGNIQEKNFKEYFFDEISFNEKLDFECGMLIASDPLYKTLEIFDLSTHTCLFTKSGIELPSGFQRVKYGPSKGEAFICFYDGNDLVRLDNQFQEISRMPGFLTDDRYSFILGHKDFMYARDQNSCEVALLDVSKNEVIHELKFSNLEQVIPLNERYHLVFGQVRLFGSKEIMLIDLNNRKKEPLPELTKMLDKLKTKSNGYFPNILFNAELNVLVAVTLEDKNCYKIPLSLPDSLL